MSTWEWISAALALALVVYLGLALFKPELFE